MNYASIFTIIYIWFFNLSLELCVYLRIMRILFDEPAAGRDIVAHKHGESPLRLGRILDSDLAQAPPGRIHRSLPQLLVGHLSETLVPLHGISLVGTLAESARSLFALLLAYKGKTLTMTDAISQLWADVAPEKSKILYRDAVWRLRRTLKEIDIPCVEWGRAALSSDKSRIECDYWEYLLTGKGDYRGEFCKTYDWSVDYLAELDEAARGKDL